MTQENALEKKHKELEETDRFGLDNPRSLVNLVPDKVRSYILEALKSDPYYFNQPENLLYTRLKKESRKPDDTDEMIRQKFWLEYDRVHTFGLKRMHMANVTVGVVPADYFYHWYLRDAKRIAWMLCPPKNVISGYNALFVIGYRRMAEILDREVVNEEGHFDQKLAQLQFNIFQAIDQRLNGTIVQKIEQKTNVTQRTVQVNVNANSKNIINEIEGACVEDLEKEVAFLKKENMLLSGEPVAAVPVAENSLAMIASEEE